MTEEISAHGTGERGTFKLERPQLESATRVNSDVLVKEPERGSWWVNPETKQIEPYQRKAAPILHTVIQDTIAPTESLIDVDRKVFESRSARDRYYKERGYSSIGTKELRQEQERNAPRPKGFQFAEHKEHWERAENDVRWGNVELTEQEKEACRRENRMLEEYQRGSRNDHLMARLQDTTPTVRVMKGK